MSDHALAVLGLVLSLVLGILGFATSYYFYVKGRERADPRYVLACRPLLGNANNTRQRISLLVNGEAFEHLNRCILMLWNKGSRTLHRSDIVDSDQTRVVFPVDSRVLDASVVESTRQSIGLTATIDEPDRTVLINGQAGAQRHRSHPAGADQHRTSGADTMITAGDIVGITAGVIISWIITAGDIVSGVIAVLGVLVGVLVGWRDRRGLSIKILELKVDQIRDQVLQLRQDQLQDQMASSRRELAARDENTALQ